METQIWCQWEQCDTCAARHRPAFVHEAETPLVPLGAYALPGRIPADQSNGCGDPPTSAGFCAPQIMRGDPVTR